MNRILAVGLLALAPCAAQGLDQRTASVGMRARIEQLTLPAPERIAKPIDKHDKLVLRIVNVYDHGANFRYDLEYYGLEPGRYDLAALLIPKDPSATLPTPPPLEVTITPMRAPGQVLPNALTPTPTPHAGGYTDWMSAGAVAWVLGLFAILFVGRARQRAAQATQDQPLTLADRLRPMVEAASQGKLDSGGKAQLERLLLAFWRKRLDLEGVTAAAAMPRLRNHAEAGALLRQLEDWLHKPQPSSQVDLAALLAPYRAVAADTVEADARSHGAGH